MLNPIDPKARFTNQKLGLRLFICSLVVSFVTLLIPVFTLFASPDRFDFGFALPVIIIVLLNIFLIIGEVVCVVNGRAVNEKVGLPVAGAIISTLYILSIAAALILQPVVHNALDGVVAW